MRLSLETSFAGAFAFFIPRAARQRLICLTLSSSRGRNGTCANGQLEFPRNLGDPVVSSANFRTESPGYQTPGRNGSLVHRGANPTGDTEVLPSEGNEARRNGRQEVIAS